MKLLFLLSSSWHLKKISPSSEWVRGLRTFRICIICISLKIAFWSIYNSLDIWYLSYFGTLLKTFHLTFCHSNDRRENDLSSHMPVFSTNHRLRPCLNHGSHCVHVITVSHCPIKAFPDRLLWSSSPSHLPSITFQCQVEIKVISCYEIWNSYSRVIYSWCF